MNLLWVTNVALPEISKYISKNKQPFGGWLDVTSELLSKENDVNLSIAFPSVNIKEVKNLKLNNINYYIFPMLNTFNSNSEELKSNLFLNQIIETVNPTLTHVFGTEFAHSYSILKVCNEKGIKNILTIQGLTSIISKHYLTGIPSSAQNIFSIRDILKQDSLKQQQKKFEKRGKLEIETLKMTSNIIGRTSWDQSIIQQVNPTATYYKLNETLRTGFYNYKWQLNNVEKHSIFISQGAYPVKGLHFMLEALVILKDLYPNVRLKVAGPNIFISSNIKDKIKRSSYVKYIRKLINKYNLENHIEFIGLKDEEEMIKAFLATHVFVSPSTIENESNSVSEAKLLGVPVVASYVGGVIDRIKHGKSGYLYQVDAPYMLAKYISDIFSNNDIAEMFSKNGNTEALEWFDIKTNYENLKEIYYQVLN